MNTKFEYKWNLWFHSEKDNWTLEGYKKIYEIITIANFWKLYNSWNKSKELTLKHFFLMKEDINPIWEDPKNIHGGCWSFKIIEEQAYNLWEELSLYLLCNKLCPNICDEIMGLSICLKKNNNVIIKIWNNNSNNNSLKLINEEILKKWGLDIIYIAHMSS